MSGTTSDVGRLLVRIEATTAQLRGQLNSAQGEIDKFTKTTQTRMAGFERSFQAAGQNALRSITGIAAGVIAVNTVTRALGSMITAMDQAAMAQARIGSAIGDMRAGGQVFDTIARSAQRTGTSANDAVDAFLRFSIATRQIGGTRDQTLQLVDSMQKLAVVSGTSGQAAGSAMTQLGQALASGRLQGDELRSIMENMPVLAELLAKELGVSVGALRQMGSEGKLVSDRVFGALLRMAPEINRQFSQMPMNVQRATASLSQAWDNLTTQLDRAFDITGRIARATQGAADAVQRLSDGMAPDTTLERLRKAREEYAALTRSAEEAARAELAARDAFVQRDSAAARARQGGGGGLTLQLDQTVETVAPTARVDALRAQIEQLSELARMEAVLRAQRLLSEQATAELAAAENRRTQTVQQIQAAQEALSGTNTKTQEQIAALRLAVEAGDGAFSRYGVSAQNAAAMLSALESRAGAAKQVIADLNLQLAQAQAGGGVEAAVLAVRNRLAGVSGTPEGAAEAEEAVRLTREVAAAQEDATARAVVAAERLRVARSSGNRALAGSIAYEQEHSAALGRGATAASARTQAEAARNRELATGTAAGGARLQTIDRVRSALAEEARAAEASAAAATAGVAATRAAEQASKARAEALKVARDGTVAYNEAYAEFLALQQRTSRAQASGDLAERTRSLENDIALIQRERELIGQLPGMREAEVAVLRVRQEMIASGRDYSEEEIAAVQNLVRAREAEAQGLRQIEDGMRQVRQISEEISKDVATVMFEAMTNDKKGEDIVDWFKAIFRRIAIQALQANVILPITQQIIGAAPGLFGAGGGSATSASGAGGIGSLFGGVGQAAGGAAGGGGVIGGFLNSSLWSSGGGWFGAGAVAAPSIAGMSPSDAMASLPATPTRATTGVGAGTTIGGGIAAVGGGYMLGSTAGGYVAGGSKARQQNAQIGAGVGAVAGLALTPFIGPLGPVVGGLVGGAIGGMIGPGKGFSGGDVMVGAGDDGQFRVMRSGGKNWDSGAATGQVQQQIDQLNAILRAAGVKISGYGNNTAATIGFGGSKNVGGPTEMFAATKAYMQTSNETLAKVMQQAWYQSFEDLQVVAPYANDNATLRGLVGTDKIRSRDDFNRASEFITSLYEPMNKAAKESTQLAAGLRTIKDSFDPVLQQAREYGLATSIIEENRSQAIEKLLKPLLEVGIQTNSYTAAVAALSEEYRAAISAAEELGRATFDIREAYTRARKELLKASQQQFDSSMREAMDRGYLSQFIGARDNYNETADAARSIGRNPDNLLIAQMRQLARALDDAQLDDVIRSLAGVDALAVSVAQAQKATLAVERAKTEEAEKQLQAAELFTRQMNSAMNIRQWVNSQRASAGPGLSPQMALTSAQSAFGEDLALARGGDADALDRIASSADALMRAGSAMYGTGPQGSALREMVLNSLENLPAVQTYDAQILAALKALGGGINVAVAIDTVRVIQEQLNLLPQAEKDKLVQTQTVVRTVQEKLGRLLSQTEINELVASAEIERTVLQTLGRDLTASERAALIHADTVMRKVEQIIGRNLTEAERESILTAKGIPLVVRQIIGRNLTAAERATLVPSADTILAIQQSIGRNLTAAERATLVASATNTLDIQQVLGRDLTAAERGRLVAAEDVLRAVQQSIGRNLTDAERASLLASDAILRDVTQLIGRNLTAAERQSLVATQNIVRAVEQKIGRDLTEAERAALIQTATVQWQVQQLIGRQLTAEERASLVTSSNAILAIQQSIGRNLTAAERATLVSAGAVTRNVHQFMGRQLTDAEKAGLVAAGAVIRSVEDKLGRQLTAAEKALIIQPGTVPRNVTQNVGAATGAAVLAPGNVSRVVKQAVETTETIKISRSIDDKIGAALNTLNYTVARHLPFLTRVPDIQQSLYLLREMARGQWGGVRVTTQKASGAANGPGFTRPVYQDGQIVHLAQPDVGNYQNTLTMNALGNAFAGGQVIPFAKGGLPEMASVPTYAPLALFGEAGPEAIMPLQRGRDGKLGVAASGMGGGELTEEFRQYRKQSAMETMALRDELRGVRSEMSDMVAAQRRANAA